jgi:hypothetical protein
MYHYIFRCRLRVGPEVHQEVVVGYHYNHYHYTMMWSEWNTSPDCGLDQDHGAGRGSGWGREDVGERGRIREECDHEGRVGMTYSSNP